MDVLGLDHVYLSVLDMDRSERFYDGVMHALGFRKGDRAIAGERHAHYFNPHLQLSLRPARSDAPHDPYAPGLHHLCLQLPTPADIDAAALALQGLGVAATGPRAYPEYHPDYYATFFEDPDGLRLELVCRTGDREDIARHWNELSTFLNPLAELRKRKG
jgi:glyoxylase I family protein